MRKISRTGLSAGALIVGLGFLVCAQIISHAKKNELLLPWYDVSSTGDGLGPEIVNYWQVPPKVVVPAAASGPVRQDVTKWNGDHALNGGNKEWAEEDGALHAFNMANWRIKILESQLNKQKMMWQLMNAKGGNTACAHSTEPCGHNLKSQVSKLQSMDNGRAHHHHEKNDKEEEVEEIRKLEQSMAEQAHEIRRLEQRVKRSSHRDAEGGDEDDADADN